ncbi:hypothetical protein B0H13DRAFT_2658973 [Mycena leptocephala]|nr:hypothetical protein B0H13DRAFT_2658973 [Mycena leptocephala]
MPYHRERARNGYKSYLHPITRRATPIPQRAHLPSPLAATPMHSTRTTGDRGMTLAEQQPRKPFTAFKTKLGRAPPPTSTSACAPIASIYISAAASPLSPINLTLACTCGVGSTATVSTFCMGERWGRACGPQSARDWDSTHAHSDSV